MRLLDLVRVSQQIIAEAEHCLPLADGSQLASPPEMIRMQMGAGNGAADREPQQTAP